jgi:hypothetical protein
MDLQRFDFEGHGMPALLLRSLIDCAQCSKPRTHVYETDDNGSPSPSTLCEPVPIRGMTAEYFCIIELVHCGITKIVTVGGWAG